eukprot:TRINITY_DN27242_c0_g2_i2.p1 TRINITY_DN27242_c0_g2~~TRINITY_DN27242_c0_g2_i2.p1  ORF type:complete len:186 (+),score=52.93 TRINITY_DN27242_c0_g2_i2:82-639(+)
MIRRPPRSTLSSSSAASDVYKRQARERLMAIPESGTKLEQLAGAADKVESRHVYEAAALGDPTSVALLAEIHERIGVVCINACRAYDPAVIVLSGGLIQAGDALLVPVKAGFRKHHWSLQEPTCEIELATSSAAGGAAFCALQAIADAASPQQAAPATPCADIWKWGLASNAVLVAVIGLMWWKR